uniref:Extended synaptotagmin 1 n=1 Tax=Ornithorhynchus anatinus TaxID=9258 RepID=A0A6I8NS35_ORNAN
MERPGGAEPEDRGTPGAHDPQPAAPPGPSGPSGPSDPPGPPDPPGPGSAGEALSALGSFGRRLLVLVPVYLAGALGLSLGFVVFGLALYLGWRRVRGGKERSLRAARRLLDDEERITAQTLHLSHRELPAWVSFPDVEKVEWLNKVRGGPGWTGGRGGAWTLESSHRAEQKSDPAGPQHQVAAPSPAWLLPSRQPLAHRRAPASVSSVSPSYVGDLQIDVEVKKYFCKAGVKGMQLHGVLRLILEPLLGDLPIVGAVSMFFIRRPMLDINWTGMTNLLDIPGLSALSDSMIMDSIAAFLVLPNRLLVPLVPDLQEVAQLRSPLPRGIVRVHLLAARALGSKDTFVRGLIEGKSDPYALVRVGTQVFCSRVVDNDLNPQWGETYEVMVHEVPGQELEVEVFDKDPDKDDFLGRMKLDLGTVLKGQVLDEWFPLQGGPGQVHLRLEWLTLLPDADKLDQVLQWNRGVSSRPDPPSAAILVVYLDRAHDLPLKKGNKEPNPMVQLSVQDVTQESKVGIRGRGPGGWWRRGALQLSRSLSPHPQVKDDTRQLALGSLTLPLSRLLSAPDLTLDQWFQLSSSGPASRLYMKLVMRILYLDTSSVHFPLTPSSPGTTETSGESFHPGSSVDHPPRPTHTSPDGHFGTESVLRIHVLEAQGLIAKDKFLGGLVRGKSDPYVKLRVGGLSFRTRVVREELSPRWNEVFEVIVTTVPGQELEVEVFDKDLDKDDFLGRPPPLLPPAALVTISPPPLPLQWLYLEDVSSGRLHLRLERLSPRPSTAELEQVLQVNSLIQTNKSTELAAALLSVYLEQAADLPLRKGTKPPSSYATISVGDSSFKTKTCPQTSAPVWDETASFLIRRPHTESLELQVRGDGSGTLGSLSLPLSDLLASSHLCLDGWLPLSNGQGQVLLRAQLGILVSQHSGVEAHSHTPSPPSEESELWGAPPVLTSSAPELRQRLLHVDSPPEAPAGQLGQVKLTVWYYTEEQKLVSLVHSCRALRQSGRDTPDPYVSLLLLPDKNRASKRKTSPKKKTLSPEFNERFEWDMSLDEAMRRKLEVSVKSNVSFMTRERELLGKVRGRGPGLPTPLSEGAAGARYDLKDDKDKGGS